MFLLLFIFLFIIFIIVGGVFYVSILRVFYYVLVDLPARSTYANMSRDWIQAIGASSPNTPVFTVIVEDCFCILYMSILKILILAREIPTIAVTKHLLL